MLSKTITYIDIDEKSQTKTYHFQLNKSELSKKVVTRDADGLTLKDRIDRLAKMTREQLEHGGAGDVISTYEEIIKLAVGERKGQLFVKNNDITDEFIYSGAYDQMFMDMLESEDSGATMISAMLPADLRQSVSQAAVARISLAEGQTLGDAVDSVLPNSGVIESTEPGKPVKTDKDLQPLWLQENRYPTTKELMQMGAQETQLAMKMKSDKAFG